MTTPVLDRLLTTLDVDLHAFAVCNIADGARLVFEPMNVVVIHYVLAGAGVLQVVGSDPVRFETGAMLIVPPRRGQSLAALSPVRRDVPAADHCLMLVDGLLKFDAADGAESPLMTICATLTATYAGSFGLFDNLVEPIVEAVASIPAVRTAFELLIAERAEPDIGTHALTEALMKQCLVLLIRNQIRRGTAQSPFLANLIEPRLAAVVVDVLRRPAAPTTLARLAAQAGMSRSAFSETFNKAFGQSPMDFVQKTRLHHAAGLLATTELPVKVVAASMGFASRSHFSRAFRTAYGVDPSGYRARTLRDGEDPPSNDGRNWLARLIHPNPAAPDTGP